VATARGLRARLRAALFLLDRLEGLWYSVARLIESEQVLRGSIGA